MVTNENGLRRTHQVSRRKQPRTEHHLLLLGIGLFILSMVSVAIFVIGMEPLVDLWLWISPAILFFICVGTAFRIGYADNIKVASPVFWVLMASGVYWGFGPLIYTFGDWRTIAQMDSGYSVDNSELFLTNMMNSFGMVALVVGLVVGRRLIGLKLKDWVRRFEGVDAMRSAGVLAAVGLSVKMLIVIPFMFGIIGTQSSTLLRMQMLSLAALMILSYQSKMRGGKATFWFVILFAVEFFMAILGQGKMGIFDVIISVLIGRTLAVRKISTMMKGFLLMGLMLIVLQPVVTGYRLIPKSTNTDYVNSVVITSTLMTESLSDLIQGRNAAQETAPQGWWSRLCYTPQQAFAISEYDVGRPGSPWMDFGMGLIPRLLWVNKPLITPGLSFSALFDNNPYSNNSPGIFGEGYYYGGWLGLLIVGLYAGLFLGGVDQISTEVISRSAWILFPLVFLGIKQGYRIDGHFSLEYMFGSVWYVLFTVLMKYFSKFFLKIVKQNSSLPSSRHHSWQSQPWG